MKLLIIDPCLTYFNEFKIATYSKSDRDNLSPEILYRYVPVTLLIATLINMYIFIIQQKVVIFFSDLPTAKFHLTMIKKTSKDDRVK